MSCEVPGSLDQVSVPGRLGVYIPYLCLKREAKGMTLLGARNHSWDTAFGWVGGGDFKLKGLYRNKRRICAYMLLYILRSHMWEGFCAGHFYFLFFCNRLNRGCPALPPHLEFMYAPQKRRTKLGA